MTTEAPGSPVGAIEEAIAPPRLYFGYYLIAASFVAQFVAVGSQNYIIGVFVNPMTNEFAWTRSEFAISRTIGMVAMALIGLYVGGYVDRHGGRRIMMGGAVVLAGALYATSFVEELWQWWLLNGLALTLGAALVGNLVVNVTLSKWFVEKRGFAIGISSMGVSMAGVVLPFVMTAVVEEWGWRAGWRVAAIGALVLIAPISLLFRRAPEDHGLNPDGKSAAEVAAGGAMRAAADFANSLTRSQALRSPQFYLLVLAFGMFATTIGVMLFTTIPFMEDAGYGKTTAALMLTVASVPALISKPIWGVLIDRFDPKRLTSISSLLTGTSLIVIVTSVNMELMWLIVVGFIMLGSGWGGLIPLQETTWASYFGRRYIGAVRSAGLPFSIGLGAASPLLAQLYYDNVGNYDGAFLIVAGSCTIAAILILLVKRPTVPPPAGV
jgi:MFS family permease